MFKKTLCRKYLSHHLKGKFKILNLKLLSLSIIYYQIEIENYFELYIISFYLFCKILLDKEVIDNLKNKK